MSLTPPNAVSAQANRPARRLLLALMAAAAVAVGVTWLLVGQLWKTRIPEGGSEVLRSELVLKEGRLHRIGQIEPYTGLMIEFHENGSLKSRSATSNGLLQGLLEGWHTNGQLEVHEYFNAGKSHGERTKWYPNGALLSKTEVVAGKLQGVFRRWHENGQLAEEVALRDGEPHGTSRAFYASGFLKAQAALDMGRLTAQKSWNDGDVKLDASANPSVAEAKP